MALLFLAVTASAAAARTEPPSPVLQTAVAVHRLPLARARQGIPVLLRAQVTYYDPYIDPRHAALFVRDASGSIFVPIPVEPLLPVHAGTWVEVRGVSGAGDFAPIVLNATVRVLGDGRLPASAPHVTLPQLMGGLFDGQWVELKGQVHSIIPIGRNLVLKLATEDGNISATTILEPPYDYASLIGATVLLHGNVAPEFNQTRQLTGVHLYFQGMAAARVLARGPADPYLLPLRPINQLFSYVPGGVLFQRNRIEGKVSLRWPGERLCVEDATGGICVATSSREIPPLGSTVEMVGFPQLTNGTPTLADSVFRPARANTLPLRPSAIGAAMAASGLHSGQLVEITGTLISLNPASQEAPLMLSSGGYSFPALLPRAFPRSRLAAWTEGSQVRLTGICLAELDAEGTDLREGAARFGSFRILLPGPEDVLVLRAPSWWNGAHTAAVVGCSALATVLVLGWVVVLRSRVDQQTQVIRQSEERFRHLALHDPLTGLANRTLLHDRLGTALARAQRTRSSLAVLMLDLDRFKQVNDSLGHEVGDQLLCAAAARVRGCVRQTDTVARIGGDEFVVLLSDLRSLGEAHQVAANIVQAIAARLEIAGQPVPVSASVGVCTYPEGGEDPDALLRNVDTALYEAKAEGRNCFRLFSPALQT